MAYCQPKRSHFSRELLMLNIFRFCFVSTVAALSLLVLSPAAAESDNALSVTTGAGNVW